MHNFLSYPHLSKCLLIGGFSETFPNFCLFSSNLNLFSICSAALLKRFLNFLGSWMIFSSFLILECQFHRMFLSFIYDIYLAITIAEQFFIVYNRKNCSHYLVKLQLVGNISGNWVAISVLSSRGHCESVFGAPGGDLLSRVLRRSTIGAGEFNGRVRNGIGCRLPAIATKCTKHTVLVRRRG